MTLLTLLTQVLIPQLSLDMERDETMTEDVCPEISCVVQ